MKENTPALDSINFLIRTWMFIALLMLVSKSLFFRHDFSLVALWALIIYGFFTLSAEYRGFFVYGFLPSVGLFLGGLAAMIPTFLDPFIGMVSQPAISVVTQMRGVFNERELLNVARFIVEHFLGLATKIPLGYDVYTMWVMAILLGAVFFLINKQKSFLWLTVPLLFFMVQWMRFFDEALGLMNLYIIGLIIYYIVNQDATALALKTDALKQRRRILLLYGMILSLLISVTATLAMAMYPLEKVNQTVSRFMPSLLEFRTGYSNPANRIFSFANTIYKPYGNRLGGTIELKHDLVMTVKGKMNGLYLRGRVSDHYEENNWTSSSPDYTVLKQFTQVEPEHALEAYKLEITYSRLETATVFAPYSFYASSLNPNKVYQNADGALFYKKSALDAKLYTYTVRGVLDSLQPALQIGDEKDPRYRSLPDSMPDQVRIMALQATMGALTDREKMEQLVNYLGTHYTYSLDVEDVPEGSDFVHYFLTESKEGYCTYFASALATMGRSMGVPTRFVEGFIMPKTKSADGSYHVTSDLAHAWVEAYIRGEGWVVFEATPPYRRALLSEDETLSEDSPIPGLGIRPNTREEEDIPDQFAGDSDYVAKRPWLTWQQGLATLMSLLFILALFRIFRIRKNLKIQFKGTLRSNTIRQYYQIELLMDKIDVSTHRFTTPESMINRLFDFMRVTSLDKNVILLIVNKALFSLHDVTGTDLNEIIRLHTYVDQYAAARLGRPRYWVMKYILNRFTVKR